MISYVGISYGYGNYYGIACSTSKRRLPINGIKEKENILVLHFLPSIELVRIIANEKKIDCLIIPLCSTYSHLVGSLWSYNVPTLALSNPELVKNMSRVAVDLDKGKITIAENRKDIESLKSKYDNSKLREKKISFNPKGLNARVSILAEINSVSDIDNAILDGANGISVIKVEQISRYDETDLSKLASKTSALNGDFSLLPLLIRFFDSDQEPLRKKKLNNFPQSKLGFRGVRFLEINRELLTKYLLELGRLRVNDVIAILPMITSVEEVKSFMKLAKNPQLKVGVTVETPAAALRIDQLLDVAEFVEIGLNDLTQYTMAWDRDYPNPERLPVDQIVAPVATLVSCVAKACEKSKVRYTLGLDLKPNSFLAKQITDLGVRTISCAPSLVKYWRKEFSKL